MHNTYEGTLKISVKNKHLHKIITIISSVAIFVLMAFFWKEFFKVVAKAGFGKTLGNIFAFKTGIATSFMYLSSIGVTFFAIATIIVALVCKNKKAVVMMNLLQNVAILCIYIILFADSKIDLSKCADFISSPLRIIGLVIAYLGLCGYRFCTSCVKGYERPLPIIIKLLLLAVSIISVCGIFYPIDLRGNCCFDYLLALIKVTEVQDITSITSILYCLFTFLIILGIAHTLIFLDTYGKLFDMIKTSVFFVFSLYCIIMLLTNHIAVSQLSHYRGSVLMMIVTPIGLALSIISYVQGKKLGEDASVLNATAGMSTQEFTFNEENQDIEFTIIEEQAPISAQQNQEDFKPSGFNKTESEGIAESPKKIIVDGKEFVENNQTIKSNIIGDEIPKIKPEAMHYPENSVDGNVQTESTPTNVEVQASAPDNNIATLNNMPMGMENSLAPIDNSPMGMPNGLAPIGNMPMGMENGLAPIGNSPYDMPNGLAPIGNMPMGMENSLAPIGNSPMGMPNGLAPIGNMPMGMENGLAPIGNSPYDMPNGLAPIGNMPMGMENGLAPIGNSPYDMPNGLAPIGNMPMGMENGLAPIGNSPYDMPNGLAPIGNMPMGMENGLAPIGNSPYDMPNGLAPIGSQTNGNFFDPFADMPLFDENGSPIMNGGQTLIGGPQQMMLGGVTADGKVVSDEQPMTPTQQTQNSMSFKQVYPPVDEEEEFVNPANNSTKGLHEINEEESFHQAPQQPHATSNPYASYENAFSNDEFLNSLSKEEREEFDKLFVLNPDKDKHVPTYVIGANNTEFFTKVFMFLGRYRSSVSDNLFNKIYDYASKLDN